MTAVMIKEAPASAGAVESRRLDADGNCTRHPSIKLRRKKASGEWKEILRTCPLCAVRGTTPPRRLERRDRHGSDSCPSSAPARCGGRDRGEEIDRAMRSDFGRRGAIHGDDPGDDRAEEHDDDVPTPLEDVVYAKRPSITAAQLKRLSARPLDDDDDEDDVPPLPIRRRASLSNSPHVQRKMAMNGAILSNLNKKPSISASEFRRLSSQRSSSGASEDGDSVSPLNERLTVSSFASPINERSSFKGASPFSERMTMSSSPGAPSYNGIPPPPLCKEISSLSKGLSALSVTSSTDRTDTTVASTCSASSSQHSLHSDQRLDLSLRSLGPSSYELQLGSNARSSRSAPGNVGAGANVGGIWRYDDQTVSSSVTSSSVSSGSLGQVAEHCQPCSPRQIPPPPPRTPSSSGGLDRGLGRLLQRSTSERHLRRRATSGGLSLPPPSPLSPSSGTLPMLPMSRQCHSAGSSRRSSLNHSRNSSQESLQGRLSRQSSGRDVTKAVVCGLRYQDPSTRKRGSYTGQLHPDSQVPHGIGTLRHADGSLLEGEWHDGVLVQEHGHHTTESWFSRDDAGNPSQDSGQDGRDSRPAFRRQHTPGREQSKELAEPGRDSGSGQDEPLPRKDTRDEPSRGSNQGQRRGSRRGTNLELAQEKLRRSRSKSRDGRKEMAAQSRSKSRSRIHVPELNGSMVSVDSRGSFCQPCDGGNRQQQQEEVPSDLQLVCSPCSPSPHQEGYRRSTSTPVTPQGSSEVDYSPAQNRRTPMQGRKKVEVSLPEHLRQQGAMVPYSSTPNDDHEQHDDLKSTHSRLSRAQSAASSSSRRKSAGPYSARESKGALPPPNSRKSFVEMKR